MEEPAYLATINAAIAAVNHGGATSISVIVVLNPRVFVKVGKKALKDSATTSDDKAIASHQTFQSEIACHNPESWVDAAVASSSSLPLSSSIRRIASFCSIGDSQRVFVGKSGSMKIAVIATTMVNEPSIKNNHLQRIQITISNLI